MTMPITKRLGKFPKKTDLRTLQFARYLNTRRLPTPPGQIDHASRLPANIGVMGNDQYGDCAVAAPGHMVQSWSVYADYPVQTISDAEILKAYFILSPNDQGCYMLDVLNYWRKTGVGVDKIEAFVETAAASVTQAQLAIQYFGSIFIGMGLPDVNTFGPWNVKKPTWPANPMNGHAVCLLGYNNTTEMFKVATWGEVWDMSYDWFKKYVDESYAVLNDLSLNATGLTPEGFDLAALNNDLAHLGDPIVDPVPVPVPVPQPPPVPVPTPPPPVVRGPMVITGSERWVVNKDGVDQSPRHMTPLEAVQHADQLRWKSPKAKILINHLAAYRVE
jgi:hypothetical protein